LFPDRKRVPRVSRVSGASNDVNLVKAPVSAALLVVALVLSSAPVLASDSGALRDYKRGQYDKALQEYQSSLQRKSDDPRLQFNTGAAPTGHRSSTKPQTVFGSANSPDEPATTCIITGTPTMRVNMPPIRQKKRLLKSVGLHSLQVEGGRR
jgi:hypothetical protein